MPQLGFNVMILGPGETGHYRFEVLWISFSRRAYRSIGAQSLSSVMANVPGRAYLEWSTHVVGDLRGQNDALASNLDTLADPPEIFGRE